MKSRIRNFLFLILLGFFLTAGLAHAQPAGQIDVTIPGISAADTSSPGGWIKGLYTFSLLGAGMLAFGVIVYAGLEHTFGAGNPSKQGDARDRILQALLGLILLVGAYIVLTTINPNLINLGLPGLTEVQTAPAGTNLKPPPPGGGDTSGTTDAGARKFLNDNGGITVNHPEPQTSLKGIHQDVLDEVVSLKKNSGCETVVNAGTEKDAHDDVKEPLYNHENGYKIDVARNACMDNYIINVKKFRREGQRQDGTPLYRAPSGAIYAQEGSHWDIFVL